jgi:hypothetical protein
MDEGMDIPDGYRTDRQMNDGMDIQYQLDSRTNIQMDEGMDIPDASLDG